MAWTSPSTQVNQTLIDLLTPKSNGSAAGLNTSLKQPLKAPPIAPAKPVTAPTQKIQKQSLQQIQQQQQPQQQNTDLGLKELFDSFKGLQSQVGESQKELNETEKQVLQDVAKKKDTLEATFKQMDEKLKQANDIPTVKTYKEVVQENNKLIPLMVGIIALGTALFGNKDGTTMADKMNAMFGALKEKSLTDYQAATQDFKNQLEQWKAKSENVYNKVNMMMQKLMLGEKIDDELAQFKVNFATNNLNTYLSLYKTTSDMISKIEDMEVKLKTAAMNIQAGWEKTIYNASNKKEIASMFVNKGKIAMDERLNQLQEALQVSLQKGNIKQANAIREEIRYLKGEYPPNSNSNDSFNNIIKNTFQPGTIKLD